MDPNVPKYNIAEIKSALLSSLAFHGEISDAIKIYEEIKQDGYHPEPRAVVCLIVSSILVASLQQFYSELYPPVSKNENFKASCILKVNNFSVFILKM
jgi:pentatricopeptide repeat protein